MTLHSLENKKTDFVKYRFVIDMASLKG